MTAPAPQCQPMTELDEWKQAASVEAGLRREFYDRALTAEAALQEAYADHRKQKVRIEELEKIARAAQRIIERDFPNGQLAIDMRAALPQSSGVARAPGES